MVKNNSVVRVPFVSVWDGDVEVHTTCSLNLADKTISDIEVVQIEGVDVLDSQYITFGEKNFRVEEDSDGILSATGMYRERIFASYVSATGKRHTCCLDLEDWEVLHGTNRGEDPEGACVLIGETIKLFTSLEGGVEKILFENPSDAANRAYVVTEWCGNCEREVGIHGWDTERDGYQAFCPHCGKPLMLCDECTHAPDYRGCDWSECAGCYRRTSEVQDGAQEPDNQPGQADQTEPSEIRVGTPLGTLVARKAPDPEYPGIDVELVRPGCEVGMPVALVEYCSSKNADTDLPEIAPELITRIWGDALNEEYTERVVHDHIEEFFKEDENLAPLTQDEIIAGLKDLIKDRESFFDPDHAADDPFRRDAVVLQAAVALLEGGKGE